MDYQNFCWDKLIDVNFSFTKEVMKRVKNFKHYGFNIDKLYILSLEKYISSFSDYELLCHINKISNEITVRRNDWSYNYNICSKQISSNLNIKNNILSYTFPLNKYKQINIIHSDYDFKIRSTINNRTLTFYFIQNLLTYIKRNYDIDQQIIIQIKYFCEFYPTNGYFDCKEHDQSFQTFKSETLFNLTENNKI